MFKQVHPKKKFEEEVMSVTVEQFLKKALNFPAIFLDEMAVERALSIVLAQICCTQYTNNAMYLTVDKVTEVLKKLEQ